MNLRTARRGITLAIVGVTAVVILAVSLVAYFIPTSVGTVLAATLCGEGSAPDYGFTYDLQQAHWTVDWQNYASEKAVTEADAVLDRLNGDSIAQTMILIKPQVEVGNRVNCAVHFLRYMKLGLPTGERKDNGFVFLIVVEPTRIEVHYGVGLGLPALTAPELTTLNRVAEDTYQSTHSIDQALLALVQQFDTVARSKYTPLTSLGPTAEPSNLPGLPAGSGGILGGCGLPGVGILALLFLMWVLRRLGGRGIGFGPSGSGSRGSGFPFGGGGGGPPMRGGSGSGRSGRGN